MDDRPVLVLGATGVFGGMACRLLRRQGVRVVAAGRNRARLDALAAELDLATEAVDLPDGLPALLQRHAPALVIDTCGPFQQRDYAVPRACIAHRTP
ncbi:MAG: saccharopine dehydrogenase NADP-binding domain-containing protein [Proteobacteria bacterium]|nr:saccharopine dehydrogenase NADP-binding domain-containing protein [Pseudomonadota bacterium]MDA1070239.1 saccharopine dehydrogenase NADP-binding domain-containing protein [Pseudomonadota bacterium]